MPTSVLKPLEKYTGTSKRLKTTSALSCWTDLLIRVIHTLSRSHSSLCKHLDSEEHLDKQIPIRPPKLIHSEVSLKEKKQSSNSDDPVDHHLPWQIKRWTLRLTEIQKLCDILAPWSNPGIKPRNKRHQEQGI